SEECMKGILVKVFEGTLTYHPSECPKCAHKQDGQIIHYGFKTTLIKVPSVSGFAAFLRLKKQRCLCKHCGRTFTLKTTVVKENCSIAQSTKLAIALDLKQKISEKDLAQKHNVSATTVMRIVDDAFKKERSQVDDQTRYYQRTFKRYMTSREVLDELLTRDNKLAATYDFYQTFLYTIKKRDVGLLEKMLHGDLNGLSPQMITAAKTLRKQEPHLLNSLIYPYHNGRIEGINNKIKVIKRIAFGYKSFLHFRNRILITQGILKIKAA
ncbi:MAG: transposase, partial [Eubacterium sp.]